MKYKIGDKVYWNDPDNGICSGIYEVTGIHLDCIYYLKNEFGSETEALEEELS